MVVFDYAEDKVRGGDAICALSCHELSESFDRAVAVVCLAAGVCIRKGIVCNIVDVVLFKEFWSYDPWCVEDDFIYPFAVADALISFVVSHDGFPLVCMGDFVVADSNHEVDVWEEEFGLF